MIRGDGVRRIKLVYRVRKAEAEVKNRGLQSLNRRPSLYQHLDFSEPAVDVFERDSEFVVEIELPGVNEKDIRLLLYANRLEIRGVKKERLPGEKLSFLRMEREFGPFQKDVVIPGDIDRNRAYAYMENGVLTVVMAKPGAKGRTAGNE